MHDDESGSYWDHVRGDAVHGPLKGHQLDAWPLEHTTAAQVMATAPDTLIFRVPIRSPVSLAMRWLQRKGVGGKGFIPPFFRRTMGPADDRLPELENGLGVVVGRRARYYPLRRLQEPVEEDWDGRTMRIALGELDRAPHAVWTDDGSRPMQLLSRWYGFAYTYPGCEILGGS